MARAAAPASGAPAMSWRRQASPASPLPSLPRKRGRVRVGWANGAADFVHACRVQREWAAKNPRAPFKAPITIIIVSLGLVRFRRAAAPMEAKIRSIGTMQLPHSHRILVGSVLVSGCGLSLRGLARPDLDLI